MKCNYLCMGCGNLKSKFIATGLLAVFGTGAFSSYAGAMEIDLSSSFESIDYDGIEFDESKIVKEPYVEKLSKNLLHNYEPKDYKLKEWIGENKEILDKIFPSTGEIVKKVFRLNEDQLGCLRENNLIPDKIDFIFNYLKVLSFDPDFFSDYRQRYGEEYFLERLRYSIEIKEIDYAHAREAITKIFSKTSKSEDVSTKDKDWIKNLYALSRELNDENPLEYCEPDLWFLDWVDENFVELYSMFPDMDDILKNSLGLNEDKINKIKRDQKFPSKVKFIVFYLKQIGVEVDHSREVAVGKDMNYIKSCIENSEEFRNAAKVVLSQIFPNLCGKLRNLVIVGIVVVALAILLLVFGALYMQKQPMSPNDQRKGQENSPTTIPSLDPEQGGNPEPEGNKFSVINEKILGLAGATIVSASAVGVGVNAAVNNNSVAVDVGKSEKVVSGNGENADKEEKVGLVYVH